MMNTILLPLILATQVLAFQLTDDRYYCGPLGIDFTIAGSSTVFPIATSWADEYQKVCPGRTIIVEGGGSSSGAARVCADESKGKPVEIGDMSRGWKLGSEAELGNENYIYQCLQGDTTHSVVQIDVAIDGISVATQAKGKGDACIDLLGGLTLDQLRWIFTSYTDSELKATGWNPDSVPNSDGNESTHLWSELNDNCPTVEIKIAGPDNRSGTYEYFAEAIFADIKNGETYGYNRPDGYFNSSEDEDIVLYIEANSGSVIGFFGFAYYYSNRRILSSVSIHNDIGQYIKPNSTTVLDGSYNPLSRRIYMNILIDDQTLQSTAPFLGFGFSKEGSELVAKSGYNPIPDDDKMEMLKRLPKSAIDSFKMFNQDSTSSSSAFSLSNKSVLNVAFLIGLTILGFL